MLTVHKRMALPDLTGDWKVDGPRLLQALTNYHNDLQKPDALNINEALIEATYGVKLPTNPGQSDANTLDAYVDPTAWTPSITFATPGDLAVTASAAIGTYMRLGRLTVASWVYVTSAFTHTTAAGALRLSGFPHAAGVTSAVYMGSSQVAGITKGGFTQFTPRIDTGNNYATYSASASGVGAQSVTAADMPTGGSVNLTGTIAYFSA